MQPTAGINTGSFASELIKMSRRINDRLQLLQKVFDSHVEESATNKLSENERQQESRATQNLPGSFHDDHGKSIDIGDCFRLIPSLFIAKDVN